MTSITSNIAAQLAQRQLRQAFGLINADVTRLTSGNRITQASDDAAGLAIGTGLRTDVSTLSTALKNTAQATSLLAVADGALLQIGEILQRQKELAVQANSGTLGATELGFLNQEFQALKSQIDQIASITNFNGINLLDGTASGTSNVATNTTGITYASSGTFGSAALDSTSSLFLGNAADLSLQGSLSGIEVALTNSGGANALNEFDFTVTINGVVYSADDVTINTSPGSDRTVTLTNVGLASTILFVLDSTTNATLVAGNDQTTNDTVAANIETDLAAVRIYQTRALADGTTGAVFNTNNVIGTAADGLIGVDFDLRSDRFSGTLAPTIGAFSVVAETSTTDGSISVTVGGSVFSTAAGTFNGLGADITAAAKTLTSADDDQETLVIDFTSVNAATIAINSTTAATALADALNAGFGVGSAGSLDFQVGLASTDLISITVANVLTTSLYLDSNGVSQTLDLLNADNAATASAVLDTALNSVLTARSQVGANQSRFQFAAANLGSSITNLDAARGAFLDTDVAATSTSFAQTQVRIQSGISVLAQANQLPQLLLKLIG